MSDLMLQVEKKLNTLFYTMLICMLKKATKKSISICDEAKRDGGLHASFYKVMSSQCSQLNLILAKHMFIIVQMYSSKNLM